MNTLLHRAFVAISGQPDTLDNPLPGCWGRTGGSRIDTQRDGSIGHRISMNSGVRDPALDRITLTELDLELPPSESRTFSGMTSAQKRAAADRKVARVEAGAVAIFWAVVGLAGSALVLSLLIPNN